MNERILNHYLDKFRSGFDIDPTRAGILFDALISGDNQFLLAELLSIWNEKGITEGELLAFAAIMRDRMKRIDSRHSTFVDVVGTGGSKAKTFNVSTAAAFVVAGAGVPVAKHGNRAATSSSGSADVLSSLGVDLDFPPEAAQRHLNELGICFMFAPRFHSLSTELAEARRAVGQPTIFNSLGPLCNPASPPHQIIGVWHRNLLEKTANVLSRLGTKRSWIVHAENGLDEIALTGKTFVAEINCDKTTRFELDAGDFGVDSVSGDLPSHCSAEESSALIREIIGNERKGHDAEKLVLINAAAAIYITGQCANLIEAWKLAEESIRNGSAIEKLNKLVADTTK